MTTKNESFGSAHFAIRLGRCSFVKPEVSAVNSEFLSMEVREK